MSTPRQLKKEADEILVDAIEDLFEAGNAYRMAGETALAAHVERIAAELFDRRYGRKAS